MAAGSYAECYQNFTVYGSNDGDNWIQVYKYQLHTWTNAGQAAARQNFGYRYVKADISCTISEKMSASISIFPGHATVY